jgi:dihydroorotate dehydrogenase (NAD+) catalytic subunit
VAGVRRSLAVDLKGVGFPLPVLAASGCFGTGRELAGLMDLRRLGGVVTRSLSYHASKGSPTPRLAETPSGIVTSVGTQNAGVHEFLDDELPRLRRAGLPVVASICGSSLEEYLRVASALQGADGIVALEAYLGCADEERGGAPFHSSLGRLGEVVGAVSRLSRLPVFAKLPALLPDLVEAARACVRVGAHGLTLIDSVPAMVIDVDRARPRLGIGVGGLSGPAIRPIAVAAVFTVARALPGVPIMGVGGISTGEDAIEFLLAGAWAVQVGTALLVNPSAPAEVADGILRYLKARGLASPADLRGQLQPVQPPAEGTV